MNQQWNAWAPGNWTVTPEELLKPDLPMVTVGILNHNRCEELRRTLDVITRAALYPKLEVIVVDNGSTDGSIQMVRSEYPSVRLHEVGWNKGTSARNFEAQLACGKYLFSYDDDTFPGTPASIFRMVQHMETHPEVDVLVGTYYQPIAAFDETGEDIRFRIGGNATEGFEGIFLAEGGTCFRLRSLKRVDGYDPGIICYREGYDLALQIFKAGYRIRFCPWFVTLHFRSAARASDRFAYFNARHHIWVIAKHWPWPLAFVLLILWVLRRTLGMVLHPETALPTAKGLWNGFIGVRPFLKYRPKLSLRQIIGLKRFYLQLFRW